MISDLLDVTLIRSGEPLPLRIFAFNLAELLKICVDEFAAVSGARLELVAPSEVVGNWDHDALRRLVDHLPTNALKHGTSFIVKLPRIPRAGS